MIATFINCALVIVGSLLGLLLKGKLPQRFLDVLLQAMGLCVLTIGISGAIGTNDTLCVIVCMALGTLLGEAIDIETRLNAAGDKLRTLFEKNGGGTSTFTEGFVSASLIFCVGAMAIVGSIDAGVKGDYSIIISKGVIDGITSISLTAALGIGVAFSALFILLYQGSITLLAGLVAGFLQEAAITEMSAVGGCIIIGIAVNMLKLAPKPIKIGNMLPAIFLPLAYLPLSEFLTQIMH